MTNPTPTSLEERFDEMEEKEWKDSYQGKLWSTAVQKCFEAPFVEVAIQHLLFTISKKQKSFHLSELSALKERQVAGVEKKKVKKNVRDRSPIGSGSSRTMMTGVHSEDKKCGYNQALSDAIEVIRDTI